MTQERPQVVVVGLGYVGLPLAVALADHFPTIGFDIDERRIADLRTGVDRTREVGKDKLLASPLALTSNHGDVEGHDIYIVTVPTPVDGANRPDLGPVLAATRTVGGLLRQGRNSIVIYESTVYPGVTEDICGPELERVSGLRRGEDFFLGYSPERINPGDKEHTVHRIIKVVAAENAEILDRVSALYGAVTSAGCFRAASIKTAEAAKVIENAQRDINIAFMNEITQIFHCAQSLGHLPRVILAGRSINDGMGSWVADCIHSRRQSRTGSVLVLGLTFKEDVPDLRNSKVIDVIRRLRWLGHHVVIHDPLANGEEAMHEYGLPLAADALDHNYDVVFAAVPHAAYRAMDTDTIAALTAPGGLVADLKGIWRDRLPADADSWSL